METQDTKGKIVKETFPSEIVSIVGDIFAGMFLLILILPLKSFPLLILIVPALLSLRGNNSGPFIARTSRDLIIGEFNRRSFIENAGATFTLSIGTALLIGTGCTLLDIFFFKLYLIGYVKLMFLPMLSIIFALSVSIPCSVFLNILAFRRGFNPNNVVNPLMTAIDDFFTVISFYLAIILLGVP